MVSFHSSLLQLVDVMRVQVFLRAADAKSLLGAIRNANLTMNFHLVCSMRSAYLSEVEACGMAVTPFKGMVPSMAAYRF